MSRSRKGTVLLHPFCRPSRVSIVDSNITDDNAVLRVLMCFPKPIIAGRRHTWSGSDYGHNLPRNTISSPFLDNPHRGKCCPLKQPDFNSRPRSPSLVAKKIKIKQKAPRRALFGMGGRRLRKPSWVLLRPCFEFRPPRRVGGPMDHLQDVGKRPWLPFG